MNFFKSKRQFHLDSDTVFATKTYLDKMYIDKFAVAVLENNKKMIDATYVLALLPRLPILRKAIESTCDDRYIQSCFLRWVDDFENKLTEILEKGDVNDE